MVPSGAVPSPEPPADGIPSTPELELEMERFVADLPQGLPQGFDSAIAIRQCDRPAQARPHPSTPPSAKRARPEPPSPPAAAQPPSAGERESVPSECESVSLPLCRSASLLVYIAVYLAVPLAVSL